MNQKTLTTHQDGTASLDCRIRLSPSQWKQLIRQVDRRFSCVLQTGLDDPQLEDFVFMQIFTALIPESPDCAKMKQLVGIDL